MRHRLRMRVVLAFGAYTCGRPIFAAARLGCLWRCIRRLPCQQPRWRPSARAPMRLVSGRCAGSAGSRLHCAAKDGAPQKKVNSALRMQGNTSKPSGLVNLHWHWPGSWRGNCAQRGCICVFNRLLSCRSCRCVLQYTVMHTDCGTLT